MADISQIKLPDGTSYDIKDTTSGYVTTDTKNTAGVGSVSNGLLFLIGTPVDGLGYNYYPTNIYNNVYISKDEGLRIPTALRIDDYYSSYYGAITTNPLTTNRVYLLPDKGGTFALTSDIPSVSGKIDTAGTGLSKSGTTLNHSNSITAQTTSGIYPIKIDAQGHITEYGTAPTTLGGYGIIDASISNGIITLGSNTITPLTSNSTLDASNLSGTIPSGCYTDTNTTYSLSNALSSHKFTSTLTAGGSGSGTSTATIEFVAGTGITLTDDTTNKTITIASSVTNTDTKVSISAVTPSSATSYFPTFYTSSSGTSVSLNSTANAWYRLLNGTTSTDGYCYICAGNSTASGSNGNMYGGITIYGKGAYYTNIIAGTPTAHRTITLPNATGTVALLSKTDANALIASLDTATANAVDDMCVICGNAGTDTNTYYRRPVSKIWNYIKNKTDAVYLPLTGGTVTGATSFGSSVLIDALTAGSLIVNGNSSFVNPISGSITGLYTPRVGNANTIDVNDAPTQYTTKVQEYGSTCLNLPSSQWYFVQTIRGQDIKYAAQLAFGETTEAVHYRLLNNNTWGSWKSLINTDTKVTISALTPSSETTNYILTHTSTSGTTTVGANAKARMWEKEGTTSSGGYISLALGNNVATGTDGNSTGNIYLYGTTAYFNKIAPGGPTSNLTQTLPTNGSGTLINTVGGQTIDSTLQIKNILTLYREGTTANDYATGILFKNKDTTTGYTNEGCYIYAYQDHGSAATNGCNLVIRPGGNLFIGSGEAPSNHYALYKNSTTENIYLTADNYLYAQAGGGTIANRKGFRIDDSGNIIPCQADTDTNNVGSIGLSQYKWADLYVTNINGVAVGTSPKFTDNNNYVTQGASTSTAWRKILLHYSTNSQGGNVPDTVTNTIYAAKGVEVQPSTGVLSAGGYIGPGSVEYIKGTQTGSTNAWTGTTKEAALYDGKMIMYLLPYAGTSTGATLNLTLSGGTTTGAKSIYRYAATTAVTTHFAAGSRILMIYDSTNTRWNTVAYYNSNTTYSAGTGLSLSSTTFNHSNSVTAVTTEGLRKIKYDAQGHITGSTAVAKADITGLGIPGSNTTYSAGNGLKLSSTTFSIQYAVGDVIITSTNTNPSGTYGGTWELIDKDYAYKWIDYPITFNTTNTQNGTSSAIIHGHTIQILASWGNKVALSDTATTIGTISYSTLGGQANSFYNQHAVAFSDNGNAVGFVNITVDNTNNRLDLNMVDYVQRTAPQNPTGNTFVFDFIYLIRSSAVMSDSLCDRFYWKRTA